MTDPTSQVQVMVALTIVRPSQHVFFIFCGCLQKRGLEGHGAEQRARENEPPLLSELQTLRDHFVSERRECVLPAVCASQRLVCRSIIEPAGS
jgi:hypothetical protein